ncbi:hypothetical protein SLA2020_014800 [Shorea laevis]
MLTASASAVVPSLPSPSVKTRGLWRRQTKHASYGPVNLPVRLQPSSARGIQSKAAGRRSFEQKLSATFICTAALDYKYPTYGTEGAYLRYVNLFSII